MTNEEIIKSYTDILRNPTPPGTAVGNAMESLTSAIATPAYNQIKTGDFSYKDAMTGMMDKNKKDWEAVVKERYPDMSPLKQKVYGMFLNALLDPINLIPGAMMAGEIKNVKHVSPHLFDKFDLSKVGTGEGHQAFGHGGYFTDSLEVVKNYVKSFGRSIYPSINDLERYYKPGNIVGGYGGKDKVIHFKKFDNHGMEDWSVAVKEVDDTGKEIGPMRVHHTIPSYEEMKSVLGDSYQPTHVYDATIKEGQPHNMLKWDEPVPKVTTDAIRNQLEKEGMGGIATSDKMTGDFLYRQITNKILTHLNNKAGGDVFRPDPKLTSEFLKRAGIDGIEYPVGSLSGPKGSPHRNYVIFDDKDIKINKRESR